MLQQSPVGANTFPTGRCDGGRRAVLHAHSTRCRGQDADPRFWRSGRTRAGRGRRVADRSGARAAARRAGVLPFTRPVDHGVEALVDAPLRVRLLPAVEQEQDEDDDAVDDVAAVFRHVHRHQHRHQRDQRDAAGDGADVVAAAAAKLLEAGGGRKREPARRSRPGATCRCRKPVGNTDALADRHAAAGHGANGTLADREWMTNE